MPKLPFLIRKSFDIDVNKGMKPKNNFWFYLFCIMAFLKKGEQ